MYSEKSGLVVTARGQMLYFCHHIAHQDSFVQLCYAQSAQEDPLLVSVSVLLLSCFRAGAVQWEHRFPVHSDKQHTGKEVTQEVQSHFGHSKVTQEGTKMVKNYFGVPVRIFLSFVYEWVEAGKIITLFVQQIQFCNRGRLCQSAPQRQHPQAQEKAAGLCLRSLQAPHLILVTALFTHTPKLSWW